MKQVLLAFSMAALTAAALAAPDEEILGKSKGYPVGTLQNYLIDETYRVGSQSNMDQIFRVHTLSKADRPAKLRQGKLNPAFRFHPYVFTGGKVGLGEKSYSIEDYLARQRVTGLLILKGDEILFERYQYDRLPTHRFVSHSMAKSITSLAVGFALAEGKIKSLDDTVATYVKPLAGYAYGETTIRNVLRMSSGVKFSEAYDGKDDLTKFLTIRWTQGHLPALQAFNERDLPQGTRFRYATSETYLLGLLLRTVTGKPLADYVAEKIWKPMGAESDAKWVVDPKGEEYAGSSFNAVLRDYGRLGMLLANDGKLNGVQILPKKYLLEATDWRRHPPAFHPLRATPALGYGYQFWLMPGEKRRFGLIGIRGQFIYVDPESKLVLVQTAVAKNPRVFDKESMGGEFSGLWMGLLQAYGKP